MNKFMTELVTEFVNNLKYTLYESGNFAEFERKWMNIIGKLENEQYNGVQLFTARTILD